MPKEPRFRLIVRQIDCGYRFAVAIKVGKYCHAWRFPNPFRIRLSDAEFYAGRKRWRWPVSMWARR